MPVNAARRPESNCFIVGGTDQANITAVVRFLFVYVGVNIRLGNISQAEMDTVFNMGIGFVMIVSPYFAESIQRQLMEDRVPTFEIGEVREGEAGMEFT